MKKLGWWGVARPVQGLPWSVVAVDGDTFQAESARGSEDAEVLRGVSTVRYHAHFVKMGYSLLDALCFLPHFKPGFLKLPSAGFEKEAQFLLQKSYSGIFSRREM